jgi:tRNA nucleotidyltransferase (CCA-adding enzyme)
MEIPPHVARALKCLEDGGFAAYVVGGCVRDALMDAVPHDWDVASAALPEQTAELFADARVLETGKRHGTLTILFSEGPLEITTFRSDGDYLDGRHPEQVRFVATIEEDLARRDFTMNAVAFNPRVGFIDPFRGRYDIEEKLIRSVGDPDERLQEDALRIMRALRFAATLGFRVDEGLAVSLHANCGLLARIAPERLSAELLRMLVGAHVLPVLLAYPDVLAVLIPEITATVGHDQKNPYHQYDIWEHTAHAIAAAKPDPVVRLALLMHDLGKPETFTLDDRGRGHFYGHDKRGEEIARVRMEALRFSGETSNRVRWAVRDHRKHFGPDNMLKWLHRLGEEQLRLLIDVKRGDMAAHVDSAAAQGLKLMDICETRLDELIEEEACFRLRDLAVSGDDLKSIGFEEGVEIGRVLALLLEAVVDGKLQNDREELLAAAHTLRSDSYAQGDEDGPCSTRAGQTPHIMDA